MNRRSELRCRLVAVQHRRLGNRGGVAELIDGNGLVHFAAGHHGEIRDFLAAQISSLAV
jgi:hypothetical protein